MRLISITNSYTFLKSEESLNLTLEIEGGGGCIPVDLLDRGYTFSHQEEIIRLSALTPTQCKMLAVKHGNEEKTFQSCKSHLQTKVREKCEDVKIEDPGTLLYCKDRGHIECCFRVLQILWHFISPM